MAKTEPQVAHALMTKSAQHQWPFAQRTHATEEKNFQPLTDIITRDIIPRLTGRPITEAETKLLALPVRHGGIKLSLPHENTAEKLIESKTATKHLQDAILRKSEFSKQVHAQQMKKIKIEFKNTRQCRSKNEMESIMTKLDNQQKRCVERAVDYHTGSWLTACPTTTIEFDLSREEFRDALALRYGWQMTEMPATCDGCNARMNVAHALECKKGGMVIRRHNEVRDALGDLCSLAWGRQIVREPVIREAGEDGKGELRADLMVRGIWSPQGAALIDIRVTDSDATSNLTKSVGKVMAEQEEKKNLYVSETLKRRGTFTPFVVTVDGASGDEATALIRSIARRLSAKWAIPYSQTAGWVRQRIAFAIIRATHFCLRGSRVRWRSLGIEDGGGLSFT
eukprot:Selendium_serpulae@DN5499_c0_g1_i6.p1